MSKISDELRDYGRRLVSNASPFNCTFGDIRAYQDELADRIDAEMVELPRDADGVPIHVGDTVYLDDGCKAEVTHIDLMYSRYGGTSRIACFASGKDHDCFPSGISHTRPDSLERIANELEGLSVDSMVGDIGLLSSCALDLAKRIRRLAKREDRQ